MGPEDRAKERQRRREVGSQETEAIFEEEDFPEVEDQDDDPDDF